MTYKIGTRVKKIAGGNLGITGLVVKGPSCTGHDVEQARAYGYDVDMYVRIEQNWVSLAGIHFKGGDVAVTNSNSWEPIIPEGNKPSSLSFTELLESLKEEKYG